MDVTATMDKSVLQRYPASFLFSFPKCRIFPVGCSYNLRDLISAYPAAAPASEEDEFDAGGLEAPSGLGAEDDDEDYGAYADDDFALLGEGSDELLQVAAGFNSLRESPFNSCMHMLSV